MTTDVVQALRDHRALGLVGALLIAAGLAGCQGDESEDTARTDPDAPPVIEVRTVEYAFVAPDSVPSGWVTFRLNNKKAAQAHQLTLARLPEGREFAEFAKREMPYRDSIFSLIDRGRIGGVKELISAASKLGHDIDETVLTDQGVVSPGRVARKTVYLDRPGTYVMSCFVRGPGGLPHLVDGMIRALHVTGDSTGASPPTPDVELEVDSGQVRAPDTIESGTVTVAARLGEERQDNAVHLVRAGENTDPMAVKKWRRAWTPDGREVPPPTEFLGGTALLEARPAGTSAYFTVEDLEPGRYAWLVSGSIGRPENALWKPVTAE